MDQDVQWQQQSFTLSPERALFWREKSTLIFSDVHLGKAHDFQAAGIPVPASVHEEDLARIAVLLEKFNPARVLILGDFVHSHDTALDDLVAGFRALHGGRQWILALGNHDWRAREKLTTWGFDAIVLQLEEDGIVFSHDLEEQIAFGVSGHVHPVVRLGSGRDRMRLPCFVFNEKRILLPSFGSFTGGFEIRPAAGDRIFVAAHGSVVAI